MIVHWLTVRTLVYRPYFTSYPVYLADLVYPTPLNHSLKLFSSAPADGDVELVLMFPMVFPMVENCDTRFRTKYFFSWRRLGLSLEQVERNFSERIITFPDILFIALRPSAARASANRVIQRTHVFSWFRLKLSVNKNANTR